MVDERDAAQARPSGLAAIAGKRGGWMTAAGLAALLAYTGWKGVAPQHDEAPPPTMAAPPPVDVSEPPKVTRVSTQIQEPPPPPPNPQATFTQSPFAAPSPPAAPLSSLVSPPPLMTSYAVRPPAPRPAASGSTTGAAQQAPEQQTKVAFAGQTLPGLRAGRAMDTSLMLRPGLYGCTLDVAVNSEVGGPFLCHTESDILSDAGVTLMGKGTTIVGQIQNSGTTQPGQSRIPSLMISAMTPDGIPVPLSAQTTDALGRAGMDGRVNRHLAERFGGAAALILSQSALDLARSALMQGNGNSMVTLNTGSVQGVAQEALRNSMNIPNTVDKNQGEAVAFIVTQPVDFSDAIRLRVR